MPNEVRSLQTRNRVQKEKIVGQNAQIATLKAALRVFTDDIDQDSGNPSSEDEEDDVDDEMNDSENEDDRDGEIEEGLPQATWDLVDRVYRCNECSYEVVDGFCQAHSCSKEFDCDTEEDEHIADSRTIESEGYTSDRSLAPRGTTPLLDIGNPYIPVAYKNSREEEYCNLLKRGAAPLMCETFDLQFNPEKGIVAWADGDIYEQFAGPAMQVGDFWKIHIGRCILLEADDYDGSKFLEGLLEDVLLFPLRSPVSHKIADRWETVEESLGIWVTRPMTNKMADDDDVDCECTNRPDGLLCGGEEVIKICQIQDHALETPEDNTNLPVIRSNSYDTSEDVDDEDDVEMHDSEPGVQWQAGVPDAVWKHPDGNEDEDGDEDGEVGVDSWDENAENESSMTLDDVIIDSTDSDFDSDEILSGDEEILLNSFRRG